MAALGSAAINDCKEGLALVAITPPPKGQRERPKNYSHNKANAALQQPQLQACEKAAPQQPQQDRNNGQHCNSANKAHAQPVRGATLTDDQLRQAVRLQPEEVGQFRELFQQATSNADKLHGQVAVAFLKRTGLPHVALKSIWEICDRNGKGHLTRSEFVLAARLVALAQVYWGCSLSLSLSLSLSRSLSLTHTHTLSYKIQTHTHIYIYKYVYIYVYICVCVRIYIHIHKHINQKKDRSIDG